MNGRRLQIGAVSVSASPWVGTQSGVSPIQSPLEAEAVEGCQAQLHLLPMGGLGVPGQRSKKDLMGAGGGELADLIIPTSIIYLSVIFLTEPAHGGPPLIALLAPLCTLFIRGGICKESRFTTGVQTQMSWLCSRASFAGLSMSLLNNLRNGPVKPRRGVSGNGQKSIKACVAQESSGCKGFLSSSPTSQPAGVVGGRWEGRKDMQVSRNRQRPPSRWQILRITC